MANPHPSSNRSLSKYIAEIGIHQILSEEEEKDLGEKIQGKDKNAKEIAIGKLVLHNLKLGVKIASEFQGYGCDLEDLVSESNIGLRRAAERFNPHKGAKFSTYASWWVKQAIKRYINNHGRTIRIPIHMGDRIIKIRKMASLLTLELGREPTHKEIAEALGVTEKTINKIYGSESRVVPLESPLGNEGTTTWAEIIADEKAEKPDYEAERANDMTRLAGMIKHLSKKEKDVLVRRYGLGKEDPQTLEDIGDILGVTRERVRQIQNKALVKLKKRISNERTPLSKPKGGEKPLKKKLGEKGIELLSEKEFDDIYKNPKNSGKNIPKKKN